MVWNTQGSIVVWQEQQRVVKQREDGSDVVRARREPTVLHEDLIGDAFWRARPELLQ